MKKKNILLLFSGLFILIIALIIKMGPESFFTSKKLEIRPQFLPQENYLYEFSYKTKSKTSFNMMMPIGQSDSKQDYQLELDISGFWAYQKIESTKLRMILIIQNHQTRGLQNVNLEQLQKPLIVSFDQYQKITAVQFDSTIDSSSRMFLKNLLYLCQITLPTTNYFPQQKWSALENDSNGEYFVDYHLKSENDDVVQIVKNNKRYNVESHDRKGVKTLMSFKKNIISFGSTEIKLNRRTSAINSLDSKYETKMTIDGTQVANSEETLTLKEVNSSEKRAAITWSNQSDVGQTENFNTKFSDEESQILMDRQELGSLGTKEIIRDFLNSSSPENKEAIDRLYLKIKALLSLYPESAKELEGLFAKLTKSPWGQKTLLRALGSVGNEQCQEALLNLINSSSNLQQKSMITLELGNLKKPSEKSEKFLRDLIQNTDSALVASTAGLTLGMMAYQLSSFDAAREKRIVEDFISDLKDAQNEAQKNLLISALGNSGSSNAKDELIDLAISENTPKQLKAESIRSLRLIAGEETTDQIAAFLKNPDQKIQEAALFALSYRLPTDQSLNNQKELYKQSNQNLIKQAVVQNMIESMSTYPQSREWLVEVTKIEKDPEMRTYLQNKLNQL